jgi:HTH-type transcriptional regulator/antitoxin HigA
MATTKRLRSSKLPGGFEDLVSLMPPRAIGGENHYDKTVAMIDRLMASGKLTRGQAAYLETLVQLVQAYETVHHAIDVSRIRGVDSLKHLMVENGMTGADLARLLKVHASMGSKILKGERSLTVEHMKKLAARFKVSPGLFID